MRRRSGQQANPDEEPPQAHVRGFLPAEIEDQRIMDLDVVKQENAPTSFINKTRFGKVVIKKSEDLHIGPKFVGGTVNYIEKRDEKSLKRYILLTVALVVSLFVLLAIGLVVMALTTKNDKPNPPPTEPPTPQPTTGTVTPTSSPPPTEPITTTGLPPIPEHWLVPYSVWSREEPLKCKPLISQKEGRGAAWTVSIDYITGCDNMTEMQTLQAKSGIHYNFYIDRYGAALEGYGWECAPEYNLRFSRTNIIIAICGEINKNQEEILKRLLQTGVKSNYLASSYNILPECCRGFSDRRGPGYDISFYLMGNFQAAFRNVECAFTKRCKGFNNSDEKNIEA